MYIYIYIYICYISVESRTFFGMSLAFCQETPALNPKAVHPIKRAPYWIKRAPTHWIKKAPEYSIKRAPTYSFKPGAYIRSKKLYIWSERSISWSNEPCFRSKEPYARSNQQHTLTKEPYTLSKEMYVSSHRSSCRFDCPQNCVAAFPGPIDLIS